MTWFLSSTGLAINRTLSAYSKMGMLIKLESPVFFGSVNTLVADIDKPGVV